MSLRLLGANEFECVPKFSGSGKFYIGISDNVIKDCDESRVVKLTPVLLCNDCNGLMQYHGFVISDNEYYCLGDGDSLKSELINQLYNYSSVYIFRSCEFASGMFDSALQNNVITILSNTKKLCVSECPTDYYKFENTCDLCLSFYKVQKTYTEPALC